MLLVIIVFASSCPTESSSDEETFSFGIGINIGNTLDSIGTHTWLAGETGWGNPRITKEFIGALSAYGYKTIRLPVTWAENIGSSPRYTIDEAWMDRVEEVVNWILDEGLVCILNIHHDGGHADKSWILRISTNEDETLNQFKIVWRQIADRFRNSSQRLILESMNEVGFDDIWNRWSGNAALKAQAYRKLNLLNQAFVDTVRATGGNNAQRQLLIAGYWTDVEQTCDPLFEMPADVIEDRLLVSVHYYTPPTFCIAEDPDNSWGFRATWGTSQDMDELSKYINMLKVRFIDNGIPVVMGEYGVTKSNKDEISRVKWMTAVTQACIDNDIVPILWDTGINPERNNFSGEIHRYPPFAMTDTLKEVLASLKMKDD